MLLPPAVGAPLQKSHDPDRFDFKTWFSAGKKEANTGIKHTFSPAVKHLFTATPLKAIAQQRHQYFQISTCLLRTSSSSLSIIPNQDASIIRIRRKGIQREQFRYQQPGMFPILPAMRLWPTYLVGQSLLQSRLHSLNRRQPGQQ